MADQEEAMIIIGIDPGARGAIAVSIDGEFEQIEPMPADEVKVGKSKRMRVNAPRLATFLKAVAVIANGRKCHVYIENVSSLPKEGVASAYAFGKACGIVEGVVAALELPHTFVTPQEWKKALRCPKDKGATRRRASELFPLNARMWSRVKDDGKAEAALIAHYGAIYDNLNRRLASNVKPGRRIPVAGRRMALPSAQG
jgi:crossover junction endodeoxyribonuclease RuvC